MKILAKKSLRSREALEKIFSFYFAGAGWGCLMNLVDGVKFIASSEKSSGDFKY